MEYKYLAFISYKSEDRQWAKWLQHKLEYYKFPTSLRKQNPSLPKRVYPVFRDITDLAGGVLSEAIKEALVASKYLIVVCSPRVVAEPEWVSQEIQEFINLGRERYIIPFIIDGEPNSANITTECFTENLKELNGSRELLGININEMGRDAAAIKVVARMFCLDFDTLWQRRQREKRRHRRTILALSLLGVIVAFIIAGVMFAQYRKMQINQARAVAHRATQLVEQNESYLARKLLVEVLPDKNDLIPRPYVPEAEAALRLASERDSHTFSEDYGSFHGTNSFSPDGKYLVSTAFYHNFKLWDVESGKCIKVFEHSSTVNSVSFSPDGKYIASASYGGTIKLWNLESGKCINTFDGHSDTEYISFSPDGKYIVSASDCTIKLWDVLRGECIKTIGSHGYSVNSAQFSPNGEYIASASEDGTIKLWDAELGTCIKTFEGQMEKVRDISFSPDGKYIASASDGGTIKLWNVELGTCLKTLYEGDSSHWMFGTVEFSSDGRYIVFASKDDIRLWDLELDICKNTFENYAKQIQDVSFSPNGRNIAVSSAEKGVSLINIKSELCWKTIDLNERRIQSASLSHNDKYLVFTTSEKIILWDIKSGKHVKTFDEDAGVLLSAEFVANGEYIISKNRWSVKLWDVESGKCIKDMSNVSDISVSPDGKYIVSGSRDDHTIKLWDVESGKCINTFDGHSNTVLDISFSLDGKYIVSASCDRAIKLWNVLSGECIKTIGSHEKQVNSVQFSPDGKYIVSSDVDVVKLWDVKLGKCLFSFDGKHKNILFTPNSKYVVYTSGNNITTVDVANGAYLRTFKGRHLLLEAISISPDSKYIVSLGGYGTIKLWDIESGEVLQTINSYSAGYHTFSHDGDMIITASGDGIIRLRQFDSLQNLIDGVHEQFKDNPLTDEERRKYYLE